MKSLPRAVLIVCSALSSAFGQANHVVLSEIYGGGGNSGATWKNDFIELYNPTSTPVNLNGWSVQYASATNSTWSTTNLSGSIPAHGFFLIQEAPGAGGTVDLPTPDVSTGAGGIAMSLSAGKVALVSSTTALTGTNPTGGSIVDKVGYGATANGYEGSGPAPAPSNTSSIERKANSSSTALTLASGGMDELLGNGYDTDNNSTDFVAQTDINPQNSSSSYEPALATGGNGTGSVTIAPSRISAGDSAAFVITILGDGTNTLDSIIISTPAGWVWGQSAGSISLSGSGFASASLAVVADTIYIGGAAITASDTGIVTISSVQSPSNPGPGVFIVSTGSQGGAPVQLQTPLTVSVTKVVPIVDLHVNNSQGVCASPYAVGTQVTVAGVIVGDLSPIRTDVYVQDATAGVDIFKSTRSYDYQVGDSVTVSGTITQFRGLTEIGLDSTKYILHSRGNPIPDPLVLTASDVNSTFNPEDFTEKNEGRLVRINSVTATSTTITDGTGTTGFFAGTLVVPSGSFDLIGILKQYVPGTGTPPPPYTGSYEVDPRFQSDLIVHPGPSYVTFPAETTIQSNSVTIAWKTGAPASSVVRYGLTASYTDSVVSPASVSSHAVLLSGLNPSTVYHYQVSSVDSAGTNTSGDAIFSSGSPPTSTGRMDVYYNHSVSYSVALAESAKTVNISTYFITRIDSAKYSIDVALYSLSGTVGGNVASALISAKGRGVKIRVIGEHDNQGTTPWFNLKANGITVIDDTFDPVDAGSGLMHNKFAVFDYRDTSSAADDWVWTGSWNATDPGNNDDAQNSIQIQDQALAHAYTMEFNEMWGSDTDTPNASNSRFGFHKIDITPHRFNIHGIPVESYFSPSDRTTLHIWDQLVQAVSSVNVAMYTFTRSDLAQALIDRKNAGTRVHVMMDNNTDEGNVFATLQGAGVDVHLKASNITGLLHHKYAVIDADNPTADPRVITGSHNWSTSAESANDENTLIIHTRRIANLYLQEFKQRYVDAGGTDDIVATGVARIDEGIPKTYGLSANYPNPFNPATVISFQLPVSSAVSLKIYDILGRQVESLVEGNFSAGYYRVSWNASSQSSGVYFYRLMAGNSVFTRKMILLR
ncbi:MAG TPA: phospholipase D-like domain-containing protein [Bacteroidota bacterium]|nr:phospholipase D-like domain-containing protein [Bacteroidota bacterium]